MGLFTHEQMLIAKPLFPPPMLPSPYLGPLSLQCKTNSFSLDMDTHATFFNILLLFSCPAGVESVDDTIVLGKLDTGQYIGGKQLNSLQGKHHEHRHSKCNKC